MEPLLNIATSAARQAGDVIVRHMELLDRVKVSTKNQNDIFSEVDVKAEQSIINAIRKAHPDHGIIAEESGIHETESEYVWIIDPLDGTSNYLHGFPFFSVSIAVKHKNRLIHGVIYDPLRHEFFSASKGSGARLNDRKIRVSKQTQLPMSLLGAGFHSRDPLSATKNLNSMKALVGQCAGIRKTGSAALDLAYVASGRLDGFWDYNLKPWDMAAGILIVREAGGLVSDLQGGDDPLKKGEIVAGTPKVFKSLLQTLSIANKM